mmetsp:Transcript_6250/g.10522  ORF Transcript_6250/g.10522 Transcript_6250/m.10522 type:complete len:231 (+) Transcript_6250:134-826(+)
MRKACRNTSDSSCPTSSSMPRRVICFLVSHMGAPEILSMRYWKLPPCTRRAVMLPYPPSESRTRFAPRAALGAASTASLGAALAGALCTALAAALCTALIAAAGALSAAALSAVSAATLGAASPPALGGASAAALGAAAAAALGAAALGTALGDAVVDEFGNALFEHALASSDASDDALGAGSLTSGRTSDGKLCRNSLFAICARTSFKPRFWISFSPSHSYFPSSTAMQ